MALKCKINASHKVLPVEGSVQDGKGTCPECMTPDRKLTKKGFLGAHNVVLDVDTTIAVTDEGLRVGSPREAAVRRELEGRRISAQREAVPTARMADAAQAHRGPTLVRGRAMEATRVMGPRERKGDKPVRPTFDGALGRERFDPKITMVPEPAPVLSASQKRNRRRKTCRAAYVARLVQAAGK